MPQRGRRVLAMTLMAVLAVYCLTLATGKVTNDVTSASLASWRIAETGTPYLEGSGWEQFDTARGSLWIGEAPNGHEVAFRSPGPVAAGVPAYLVARTMGLDGFSIVPGSVVAALLTTIALALLALAVLPRIGTRATVLAVLALGLTTPFWSVSADSLWTHPVTLLGIGGMAWAGRHERWLLLGLFGGVAIWGRLHMALVVAMVGLGVAVVRRQPRIAVAVGSVSAGCLGLSFLWGRWMYGTWSPAGGYSVTGYAEDAMSRTDLADQLINHAGLWVAPDRGILLWTPVLLVLAPAVVRAWRDLPDWSRWLFVGGACYGLVQGQLNGFSGGSSFYGYRLTLEVLACWLPAYAMASPRAGRVGRALLGPLLGLQFAVISVGASNDGGLLPESEAWTNNSFVHLLGTSPALLGWVVLLLVGGHLAGRFVQRAGSPAPAEADGEAREEPVLAAGRPALRR